MKKNAKNYFQKNKADICFYKKYTYFCYYKKSCDTSIANVRRVKDK